ncbi:MAG: hypothetical protein AAFR38_03750 [Planctomycetota bacterium]
MRTRPAVLLTALAAAATPLALGFAPVTADIAAVHDRMAENAVGSWTLDVAFPPEAPIPPELEIKLDVVDNDDGTYGLTLSNNMTPETSSGSATFDEDSGELTGTLSGPDGSEAEFSATVSEDSMEGSIAAQGESLEFTAERD